MDVIDSHASVHLLILIKAGPNTSQGEHNAIFFSWRYDFSKKELKKSKNMLSYFYRYYFPFGKFMISHTLPFEFCTIFPVHDFLYNSCFDDDFR